jgi:hypothetical protein
VMQWTAISGSLKPRNLLGAKRQSGSPDDEALRSIICRRCLADSWLMSGRCLAGRDFL